MRAGVRFIDTPVQRHYDLLAVFTVVHTPEGLMAVKKKGKKRKTKKKTARKTRRRR